MHITPGLLYEIVIHINVRATYTKSDYKVKFICRVSYRVFFLDIDASERCMHVLMHLLGFCRSEYGSKLTTRALFELIDVRLSQEYPKDAVCYG